MSILGIIPARYASTRFPGKPLVVIDGKTMIQRVYEQAQKAAALSAVVVATDDGRIADAVQRFGGNVVMTAAHHQSGTDRCAEAFQLFQNEHLLSPLSKKDTVFDGVINIQGDEPFIDPIQIDLVAKVLTANVFDIATLAIKLSDLEDILNPNIVKVVFTERGRALYFSRSPIPFSRDLDKNKWAGSGRYFKHIGIYGYKSNVLQQLTQLEIGQFESIESLEQLRWLENNFNIGVAETNIETIGIDTPEDLIKLNIR